MKIRLTRRLTALLVLLWTHSAAAIQLLEVRDGGVVSARISGNEPNRLVIRDGRVHKVWGAEGKAVLKPDSDAGQVYLQPSEAWRHRPFSLFVKDEEGAVYTLVLTPMEIPSETVTLIRPELATVVDQEKAVAWESEQPRQQRGHPSFIYPVMRLTRFAPTRPRLHLLQQIESFRLTMAFKESSSKSICRFAESVYST